MTAPSLIAAACVVAAAVAVLWPRPGRRARRRRVLAAASHPAPVVTPWQMAAGWLRGRPFGSGAGLVWLALAGAMVAVLVDGVVAGAAVAAYGVLGARMLARARSGRVRSRRRAQVLDALGAAAADLRAGLPATRALPGLISPVGASTPVTDPLSRVNAALRLAEQTGAPLADLIERIEADARAADRAHAAAAAQVAGSRATAWLLAALPAGGIALGYAIGADPLSVLRHTPIGAACAAGAIALQVLGLGWANRLTRGATARAT